MTTMATCGSGRRNSCLAAAATVVVLIFPHSSYADFIDVISQRFLIAGAGDDVLGTHPYTYSNTADQPLFSHQTIHVTDNPSDEFSLYMSAGGFVTSDHAFVRTYTAMFEEGTSRAISTQGVATITFRPLVTHVLVKVSVPTQRFASAELYDDVGQSLLAFGNESVPSTAFAPVIFDLFLNLDRIYTIKAAALNLCECDGSTLGSELTITPVPEPDTSAVLMMAAVVLGLRRRSTNY